MTGRTDRVLALMIAGAVAGTGLISALMLAGMYSPGTSATHRVVASGGVSAGSAGTGSSGGTSSGGGHGATSGHGNGVPAGVTLPSQGVSGGVIHLGAIVTQSGPARSTSMADAIIAWERSVNAAGGINGYKIDVDGGNILDDQGNPDLGASEYRQLWQDQKVFAFVGECAPLTDEQQIGYVQQNFVPLVGECQSGENAYSPPASASQCYCIWVGGPTPTQNGSLGAALMQRTQSWPSSGGQIALVCLNDPTTIQDCNGAAARYGRGALWNGGPQMEQIYDNNYSQLITEWQQQGITHVHLVLDPGSVGRYLAAAASASYNAQVFNNTVIDDGIAGTGGYSNANGMLIGTPWTPLDQNTPGMQRLQRAMATYYPGVRVDLYAQTAWLSCLIFEHALQLMGHDISEANLIATLNSIHGWDTGLGPVEDFSATNHVGPYESALMRLEGAGTSGWRLVTAHSAING